jgi:hypothetical protein
MSKWFEKLTSEQVKALLNQGYSVKGAGLYESDHAGNTKFILWMGRGLYRLTPPIEG